MLEKKVEPSLARSCPLQKAPKTLARQKRLRHYLFLEHDEDGAALAEHVEDF
jgi:hypothetical protein